MSDKVNIAIIALTLVTTGILIISGILLRNLFFEIGGLGMLLASFVMFSSMSSNTDERGET